MGKVANRQRFWIAGSNRSLFRSFAVSQCLKRIAYRAFRIAISNRRDASDSNRARFWIASDSRFGSRELVLFAEGSGQIFTPKILAVSVSILLEPRLPWWTKLLETCFDVESMDELPANGGTNFLKSVTNFLKRVTNFQKPVSSFLNFESRD